MTREDLSEDGKKKKKKKNAPRAKEGNEERGTQIYSQKN
jgi:hypothetical protein